MGQLNSMWSINLNDLDRFVPGETEYNANPEWQQVNTSGHKPPPISHHTSVVFNSKMYLYGGCSIDNENKNMYTLDLVKNQWQMIKPQAHLGDPENIPATRDEHSCVL